MLSSSKRLAAAPRRPHSPSVLSALAVLTLCGTLATSAHADPVAVPADASAWDRGDDASFSRYLGRPAMLLGGGPYQVRGPHFVNGRIDVDVAFHGQRGFVGVSFRHQDDGDFELFYLRPHKSRLPDAVQYTPHIGTHSAWQLYSDPGYIAAAELAHNRWLHVRVEFVDRRARIWLDDADEPALEVDLKGDFGAGAIGLWGRDVAHFSNFRYEALPDTPVTPRPAFAARDGIVDGWQLSPAVERDLHDPTRVPTDVAWAPAALEAPGFVNIARVRRPVPAEDRRGAARGRDLVWARTTVHVDEASRRKLWVGYSDEVTVLLNGVPIWQSSAAFGERYPFSLGILRLQQDALWLDLQAGDNELVFAVAESFGGWGFGARFDERDIHAIDEIDAASGAGDPD